MDKLLMLVVAALICESVWETIKMTWQEGKLSIDRIGALVVGLAVAIAAGLDLPGLVEIPFNVPYLGMVLTGILISRGANFLHDLVIKIQKPQA
jgi:hypothetical protein